MDLRNQRALVTGGAAGIGLETAKLLAAEGAEVLVADRDADQGAKAVTEIEGAGGDARFVATDMRDRASVERLAAEAGDVDILVHAAAAFPSVPAADQESPAIEMAFGADVRRSDSVTRDLAPAMNAARPGAVINITLVTADGEVPTTSVYSGTRGALDAISRTWATECGPRGLRVNTLAPGAASTDFLVEVLGDDRQPAGSARPVARAGLSAAIAQAVSLFASPRCGASRASRCPWVAGATASERTPLPGPARSHR